MQHNKLKYKKHLETLDSKIIEGLIKQWEFDLMIVPCGCESDWKIQIANEVLKDRQ